MAEKKRRFRRLRIPLQALTEEGERNEEGERLAKMDQLEEEGGDEAERLARMDRQLDEFQELVTQQLEERSREMNTKIDALMASVASIPEDTVGDNPSMPSALGGTLVPELARVAVCSTPKSAVGRAFFHKVRALTSERDQPEWIDLMQIASLPFEEVDLLLASRRALVICPDVDSEDRRSLMSLREGMKAVLASIPSFLDKAVLLSRVGAQSIKGGINMRAFFGMNYDGTFAGVEDLLTSFARRRSSRGQLNVTIVRVGPSSGSPSAAGDVRCFPGEASIAASTQSETAAEALVQVLSLGVNTNVCIVGRWDEAQEAQSPSSSWEELLLPYVGPEIWRAEVEDARRVKFFVQGWADEWFGGDKGNRASRFGVKTPVQVANTTYGVIFKFRPLGTPEARTFEDLDDGGLEFVAERESNGRSRLRVKRCAYGWKVVIKENSERALLQKFRDDFVGAAM
mmetsp:Transcript_59901/g.110961  ORF Transcript_59901/g.110961 Transcript_59901/m.110961 type:complete len:457 (+) Transcript_59901:278-1648(+)